MPETPRFTGTKTLPTGPGENLNEIQAAEARESVPASGLKDRLKANWGSLSSAISPSPVLLLLATSISCPILRSIGPFLSQFVSKRYGISLASTEYLVTSCGVLNYRCAGYPAGNVLVESMSTDSDPSVLQRIRHPGLDHGYRDVLLTHGLYAILVVSYLVPGLAPTTGSFLMGMLIHALGSGFPSLLHSLVAMYVDQEHRTRMFTLVAMAENTGDVSTTLSWQLCLPSTRSYATCVYRQKDEGRRSPQLSVSPE